MDVFTDAPKTAKACNDADSPNQGVRENYEIQLHEQTFTKLKTEKIDFKLTFKNMEKSGERMIDHVRTVVDVIQNVMHGLVKGVHPNSVCRLVLLSESLNPGVNFPNMPVSELATDYIFSHIANVLQSHEEMDMNLLTGHMILTQPPGEGGSKKNDVNNRNRLTIKKWCDSNRNLISPPDRKEKLCGVTALLGALYLCEKRKSQKPVWNYMRDQTLKTKRIAKKLKLKGPLSPENLEEVVRKSGEFQDCRLAVFGTGVGRKRLFMSEVAGNRRLNLLLSEGHYYVIKDVAKFVGAKKYCFICDSGYNTLKQHRNCRAGADHCKMCHKLDCPNREKPTLRECKILCKVTFRRSLAFVYCIPNLTVFFRSATEPFTLRRVSIFTTSRGCANGRSNADSAGKFVGEPLRTPAESPIGKKPDFSVLYNEKKTYSIF